MRRRQRANDEGRATGGLFTLLIVLFIAAAVVMARAGRSPQMIITFVGLAAISALIALVLTAKKARRRCRSFLRAFIDGIAEFAFVLLDFVDVF